MRKIIALSVFAVAAVLVVGIAAISLTHNVFAARNVGGGTFADTGGNGGVAQSGGTATSGSAVGVQNSNPTGNGNTGPVGGNTGDWGSGVDQTGGNSIGVGCGHAFIGTGPGGSSSNNC